MPTPFRSPAGRSLPHHAAGEAMRAALLFPDVGQASGTLPPVNQCVNALLTRPRHPSGFAMRAFLVDKARKVFDRSSGVAPRASKIGCAEPDFGCQLAEGEGDGALRTCRA